MIISLVNVKGGVGKTTTAVNLGAGFAGSGLRVLLVDLDPQGSASYSVGVDTDQVEFSSVDLLVGEQPIRDVIGETGVEGLDLVPGSMKLAGAGGFLHPSCGAPRPGHGGHESLLYGARDPWPECAWAAGTLGSSADDGGSTHVGD